MSSTQNVMALSVKKKAYEEINNSAYRNIEK